MDIKTLKEIDSENSIEDIVKSIKKKIYVSSGEYLPYYIASENKLYESIIEFIAEELGNVPVFYLGDAKDIAKPDIGKKGRVQLIYDLKEEIESVEDDCVILKISKFEEYLNEIPIEKTGFEAHVYDQNSRSYIDELNFSKTLLAFTHIGMTLGTCAYYNAIKAATSSQHKERLFVFSE